MLLRSTIQIPYHGRRRISQNTAASFLLLLEFNSKEKKQLELHNDILTSPIEVNMQSPDGQMKNKVSSSQMSKSPNKNFLQTTRPSRKISPKIVTKISFNAAVYAFVAIKQIARIRNEQDDDLHQNR